MSNRQATRQYWLWITGPDYYLDEYGQDRRDLDPGLQEDTEGWWTCQKNTREGDLIYLWRKSPKSDLGYLIEARSDAYSLEDDSYARQMGWKFGCEYEVLYKFASPVTFREIKADPALGQWGTVKGQFQGIVFQVPPEYWQALTALATRKDPGYALFLGQLEQQPLRPVIERERQLEDYLAAHLGLLKPFGYDLRLYEEPGTHRRGRQFICRGGGGIIDLLCYDEKGPRYVVIELKNVEAGPSTFGQIASYMGWVEKHVTPRKPVVGLVISRGKDARFDSCLRITDRIEQLDLKAMGLS